MNNKGSVSVIVAICLLVLIAICGFGIDLERAWSLKSRLRSALDAAALLAAREINSTSMQTDARRLFFANIAPTSAGTGPGAGPYGSTVVNPTFTVSSDKKTVTMSVHATLSTTVMAIFPGLPRTMSVDDVASATPGGAGLELALVLDTTGSMAQSDGSTGGTKLQALQAAVQALLDSLYGANNDTAQDLWVSVVPFITTINVGTGTRQQGWLSKTYSASAYKSPTTQYSWSGCVEARSSNNDDEDDVAPANHGFTPYFADDTYAKYGTASGRNAPCSSRYAYSNNYCMGDNDWMAPKTASTSGNPALQSGLTFGPNRGCPSTILPLTASKATVMGIVNSLTTSYSGTIIGLGVQGGWFTLSPQWRGAGGWGDSVLPHDYSAAAGTTDVPIQKALVLVSDGDDVWGWISSVAPGSESAYTPTTLYMPYGRLSNSNNPLKVSLAGSVSQTASNADAVLDTRFLQTCSNVKAAGILVYVIGLGVADANARYLLKHCASAETDYVESPTASALSTAFQQVGSALSRVRLTQ